MGRRGRTGPGGAVVSSLSTNAGGTVGAKKNKAGGGLPGGAGSTSARGGGSGNAAADDVDIVFGSGSSSRASKKGAAAAAAAGDPEEEAEAEATVAAGGKARAVHKPKPSKWLGKQPSDFLQEWCEKNNRKRHFIKDANNAPPGSRICIVPPGRRKPNKKAGGPDPDKAITGGYQDSDEAAALATLHIVERGKPLERALPPEHHTMASVAGAPTGGPVVDAATAAALTEERDGELAALSAIYGDECVEVGAGDLGPWFPAPAADGGAANRTPLPGAEPVFSLTVHLPGGVPALGIHPAASGATASGGGGENGGDNGDGGGGHDAADGATVPTTPASVVLIDTAGAYPATPPVVYLRAPGAAAAARPPATRATAP
eukprot:contig_10645_g2538